MRKLLSFGAVLFLAGCAVINQDSSILPVNTPDTMPPYINMKQYEFYTEVNHPIDFSNIGGYDDVDGLLPTRLRGDVDYTKPGEYYPSIVCTDLSNNESEVIITIHVMESGALESDQENVPEPEPTPSGCDVSVAVDPSLPCSSVPVDVISQYETVFEGEEGKALCKEQYGEEACEVILRNDGSFWGVGRRS